LAVLTLSGKHLPNSVESLLALGRELLRRQDAPAACDVLERAADLRPDLFEIAFDLGHAYGAMDRFDEAKQQLARAVGWLGQESRTYFALGYVLGELGEWQAAASAMLVAARSDEGNLQALGFLGECAKRLAMTKNKPPPPSESIDSALGKISVVICSINAIKLQRLRSNLERLLSEQDWELIHIPDARSLCEGYNRGIARSSGELLILCHDDIEIFTADLARRLRRHLATFDLIGVAGSTHATGPTWRWSGAPHIFTSIAQPDAETSRMALAISGTAGPIVQGAKLLYGVFLAARRSLFKTLSFDQATFDGFHFYDLDLSYRAWMSGARTAICRDIAVYHLSTGDFSKEFNRYAERYREKFPEACTAPPSNLAASAGTIMKTRRFSIAR
jgi:tetratricopeptide (TPR) repeat protein